MRNVMVKKIKSILFRIIVVIFGMVLLWILFHLILCKAEESRQQQRGKYVTVKEKNMNVYAVGEGNTTIVMMPGLGTTAPILDFEPLVLALSKDYRIVIVEPFGYGWSDCTDEERSIENIVEELRMALRMSGEKGPFVLMPHSVSGIYAIWYANTYPEEVASVIGIDCALPKQVEYFGGSNPHIPQLAKLVNPLGIQRILCAVSPTMFISDNKEGIYKEENLEEQIILSNRIGYNYTVINETNTVAENIEKTFELEFSENMPLLFFTTENKKSFYESYIKNTQLQKVAVLDAGHYMHWTKAYDMVQIIKNFDFRKGEEK